MESYAQGDFSGGLNLFDHGHAIGPNEYVNGFNVRTRNNGFSCIKQPVRDATAPIGRKQALFGFGNFLILVVAGRVYYKNTVSGGNWTLITGVVLSKQADVVYSQAVPASTTSYGRRLADAGVVNGNASNSGIILDSGLVVAGIQAGVVLQDGISQPFFVFQSGNTADARQLNTYNQWSMEDREYVPIGKQMAYIDGILFVASPDGKSIYRSVSGRSLDFVINVTEDGNKGGDATTTSFAVSSNTITCLKALSSGELFVGTIDGCSILEFNENKLIFGEPTFYNRKPLIAGVLSQESFIENLGDSTFIDLDGIRSFNAVRQQQNEGRNSVFSLKVSKPLEGVFQNEKSCATVFDNYCLYSVYSEFGFVVFVYDTLRQQWVSVDRYGIDQIKQFATTRQSFDPALFAITDDFVYELFASEDYLESEVFIREHTAGNAQVELRLTDVRVVFQDSYAEGIVTCTEKSDTKQGVTISRRFRERPTGLFYPLLYPLLYTNNQQDVENLLFDIGKSSKLGFKVGASIKWSGSSKLIYYQADTTTDTAYAAETRKVTAYANPG